MNAVSGRKVVASARPARQAAPPAGRVGLLVVGMHRSGTSASTRIISLLGAQLPGNLMPSHTEFNAAGFWESLDVVALNERLLAAAQSSWDDVLPIDPAGLPAGALAAFQTGAREILAREFGDSDWFVLKDPRIGRLLGPWLQAVRDTGAQPLVVIPVRHPLEVAASLHRREGFAREKSLYMWLRHMLDVIRSSRGVPRAVMVYDELMQDWRGSVQRLAADLGIEWPRRPEEIAAQAAQFLDGSLRHHTVENDSEPRTPLERWAAELHSALCARSPGLDKLADGIHAKLTPLEALMAPILRDAVRRVAAAQARREQVIEDLARSREEAGQKERHVRLLLAEADELRTQRDRGIARMGELESTLQSERTAHAELSAAFEDKQQHVAVLQAEAAKFRHERDVVLTRAAELESVLRLERAAHTELSTAFDDKVRHVEALSAQLQDLQGQRERASARAEELESVLQVERTAHTELSAAFDEKVRHVQALSAEMQDLLGQRERALARIGELEAELHHERDAAAHRIEGLDAALAGERQAHAAAQVRLQALTEALDRAHSELTRITRVLS